MEVLSRILSNEQVACFRADGAVLVPGLLSPAWLSLMSEAGRGHPGFHGLNEPV